MRIFVEESRRSESLLARESAGSEVGRRGARVRGAVLASEGGGRRLLKRDFDIGVVCSIYIRG